MKVKHEEKSWSSITPEIQSFQTKEPPVEFISLRINRRQSGAPEGSYVALVQMTSEKKPY